MDLDEHQSSFPKKHFLCELKQPIVSRADFGQLTAEFSMTIIIYPESIIHSKGNLQKIFDTASQISSALNQYDARWVFQDNGNSIDVIEINFNKSLALDSSVELACKALVNKAMDELQKMCDDAMCCRKNQSAIE